MPNSAKPLGKSQRKRFGSKGLLRGGPTMTSRCSETQIVIPKVLWAGSEEQKVKGGKLPGKASKPRRVCLSVYPLWESP